MIGLAVDASALAHGVHYGVVGIGVLGLVALLAPRFAGTAPDGIQDEHDLRIRAVHDQISNGSLGLRPASAPVLPATRPVRTASSAVLLAVVSSAAAAGVHAGVGPAHLADQVLFGLFFVGCALAQVGWSLAMVLRPTRALLRAAAVGNTAVLALWLVSRTAGLPGHPPEPFGPWDVACAAWEITTVVAVLALLRNGSSTGLVIPRWDRWPVGARFWFLGSAVVLGLLVLSGASA